MGTVFVWVVGVACFLVMFAGYGPWDEMEYLVLCFMAATPAWLLNQIVIRVVHDPEWQQFLWDLLLLASMRLMLTTVHRDEAFSGARRRIKPVAEQYSKLRVSIFAALPRGDIERLGDIRIGMSKEDLLAKVGDRWRVVESKLANGFQYLALWNRNS